jgi:predicted phage tail protein
MAQAGLAAGLRRIENKFPSQMGNNLDESHVSAEQSVVAQGHSVCFAYGAAQIGASRLRWPAKTVQQGLKPD